MKLLTCIALLLFNCLTASLSWAQPTYPDRPVRIVVPFGAGAPADIISRLTGAKLMEWWRQPVVIDNVPGAAGTVGAARVAKTAADGYTLLMSGDAAMTTAVTLYDKLAYDPLKDFVPITLATLSTNILVVHPSVPARSVQELVALAKANPGTLTYASTGSGTSQHLGGELLKKMAGIDLAHVPYKAVGGLLQDLLAGRVGMNFGNIANMLPLVREGKLRALAVSSSKRWGAIPEIPTVAEAGYPGFEAVAWFGLLAPTGTPDGVVERINQDMVKALGLPDVRSRLTDLGFEVVGSTSRDFAARIRSEIVSKGQLVKDSGAKAD
jgi:tripartite-type tricarboxylate transporter receptor subunit TctC